MALAAYLIAYFCIASKENQLSIKEEDLKGQRCLAEGKFI